jgi:DNA-3-methyladenine glycosylase II
MVGMQRIKRLDERPKRAEMLVLGEPWRPWRGAAALFLWHYLRNAAM